MSNTYKKLLAVMVTCVACGGDAPSTSGNSSPLSVPVVTPSTMTGVGAAGSTSSTGVPGAMPSGTLPVVPVTPTPNPTPTPTATPAGLPVAGSLSVLPPAPPSPPPAGMVAGAGADPANAESGSTPADLFCNKYGEHCGYDMPNRHANRAACITNFNATPAQQACKTMHIDTAIAGTAAACNGMPSAFCFSIHCLHAAGITDPTGTTYCK